MSEQHSTALVRRVRDLAEFFVGTDLLRLRIERGAQEVELARKSLSPELVGDIPSDLGALETAPRRLEAIKADLVGVFHLVRPAVSAGDLLENDRELAYVEALGIRNPVRSRGAGRLVSVMQSDGDPVEYGQVLFEIDRG
jgi:acetyl/propionyl-CoA carboxylase alpha subunit